MGINLDFRPYKDQCLFWPEEVNKTHGMLHLPETYIKESDAARICVCLSVGFKVKAVKANERCIVDVMKCKEMTYRDDDDGQVYEFYFGKEEAILAVIE